MFFYTQTPRFTCLGETYMWETRVLSFSVVHIVLPAPEHFMSPTWSKDLTIWKGTLRQNKMYFDMPFIYVFF